MRPAFWHSTGLGRSDSSNEVLGLRQRLTDIATKLYKEWHTAVPVNQCIIKALTRAGYSQPLQQCSFARTSIPPYQHPPTSGERFVNAHIRRLTLIASFRVAGRQGNI